MTILFSIAFTAFLYLLNGLLITIGHLNSSISQRPFFLLNPTIAAIIRGMFFMPIHWQLIFLLQGKRNGYGPFFRSIILFIVFWGITYIIVYKIASWLSYLIS